MLKRGTTTCGQTPPTENANQGEEYETMPEQDTKPAGPPPAPAPPPEPRHLIPLSVPEIRHMLHFADQGKRAITRALKWSLWRRAHQGDARRRHYRRRLRTQALAL